MKVIFYMEFFLVAVQEQQRMARMIQLLVREEIGYLGKEMNGHYRLGPIAEAIRGICGSTGV
jgi:hypothetical protein